MYEVELKIPTTHERVRERLNALGADRRGVVVQEDTYYDAPHRNFAETDEALRIRREEDEDETVVVTYKGPLVESESKTREEAETRIEDGDAMATILAGLGFEPAATVRKERERYSYESFTVTLDSVDGLGTFVEVETGAETRADVEPAREAARDLLARLDLDPADQIRTSYLGLLLDE